MTNVSKRLDEIKAWAMDESLNGKGAAPVGERLCLMLREIGVPVTQAHVLVMFLHPLYHGRSIIWSETDGIREEIGATVCKTSRVGRPMCFTRWSRATRPTACASTYETQPLVGLSR